MEDIVTRRNRNDEWCESANEASKVTNLVAVASFS